MAGTIAFEIVSPEKVLLAGEAEHVLLPGAEGDMGILPGHAPLVSTLRPGVIEVTLPDAKARIYVRRAFAEVDSGRVTVLAERAYDIGTLDAATVAAELAAAEAELAAAKTDDQRFMANEAIAALSKLRAH